MITLFILFSVGFIIGFFITINIIKNKSIKNKIDHVVEVSPSDFKKINNDIHKIDLKFLEQSVNENLLIFIANNFKLKNELTLIINNLNKFKNFKNSDNLNKQLLKETYEFLINLQNDITNLFSEWIGKFIYNSTEKHYVLKKDKQKLLESKEYFEYLNNILPIFKHTLNYLNTQLNEHYEYLRNQNINNVKIKYNIDQFSEFNKIKNEILNNSKYHNQELFHLLELVEKEFINPYFKNKDSNLIDNINNQVEEINNLLKERMENISKYHIPQNKEDIQDLLNHNQFLLQQIKTHY